MSRGESNHDKFERYVMNEIPIRLIRLSDMKFVGRNDVRRRFRSSVPEGTDANLPQEHVRDEDRCSDRSRIRKAEELLREGQGIWA